MDFYESYKPYLAQVEGEMRGMLECERKDVYGMLFPFISRGGKRIRPMLSMLCCSAMGGDPAKAIRPAALLEMFHNFTLIHDDIADDSRFRRGEPTLHITFGIPIALNSGDALYTLVWKHLAALDMEPGSRAELHSLCADTFKLVVDGQGMELNWYHERRFDVSEKEYFDMINRKTAALIGLSCEMGAFIGGADARARKALRAFGEKIGSAFQIHDDVLNLVGDFSKYQKEIGGDISEGKRSLIIVHFLSVAPEEERKTVIDALGRHAKKKGELETVISLLKKRGSVDYAARTAARLVSEAKMELGVLPVSPARDNLLALADFVVSREC